MEGKNVCTAFEPVVSELSMRYKTLQKHFSYNRKLYCIYKIKLAVHLKINQEIEQHSLHDYRNNILKQEYKNVL